MKSKEKNNFNKNLYNKGNNKIKITLKNIICMSFFVIILFDIAIFYNLYFQNNISYAYSGKETKEASSASIETNNNEENGISAKDVLFSNANFVNIDDIINQNISESKSEGLRQEDVILEYLTEYVQTDTLAKGEAYVVQEGMKGTQRITYKEIYENGKLVGEEQISAIVLKPAFNKVVKIGTGSNKKLAQAKVGDIVSVTSDELTVYIEPNEESDKMTKLKRDDSLKILKINGDWFYISFQNIQGWVKKESTKYQYVGPEVINKTQQSNKSSNSSSNLGTSGNNVNGTAKIKSLSFDMKLNEPSGLSLEQFQKILKDSKDVNNIFSQNAQYFYYIEKQYNINGVFVAAIGIHESAWGTSKIALSKKNLFGYGAYDSNPYNGAYIFSDYSESIDLLARVLVKYYLNPKGTSIYSGEKAVGTYYSSPNLTGVNRKYATDKNWANAVYKHMKYLYDKI